MIEYVAHMGKMRIAYEMSFVNLKGRFQKESQQRCRDNIKMDLQELGFEYVDWIQGAQDRVQSCGHGNESWGNKKL